MPKASGSSFRRFNADVFRSVAASKLSAGARRSKEGLKRILVAEDNPHMRDALEIGLAGAYEVVVVADEAAALSMLDAVQFDAMVVDLPIPTLILHEMNAGRLSLPAVFVCETVEFVRIVEDTGAACCMKPITLAVLEAQLSFVMASRFDREGPTERSIEY